MWHDNQWHFQFPRCKCNDSCGWYDVFWLHTEALAQIGLFVDEHFGRHYVSKRHEHLQNVLVPELLRQVINEKVCSFWSCKHSTQHIHALISSGNKASCLTLNNSVVSVVVFWMAEKQHTARLWWRSAETAVETLLLYLYCKKGTKYFQIPIRNLTFVYFSFYLKFYKMF